MTLTEQDRDAIATHLEVVGAKAREMVQEIRAGRAWDEDINFGIGNIHGSLERARAVVGRRKVAG